MPDEQSDTRLREYVSFLQREIDTERKILEAQPLYAPLDGQSDDVRERARKAKSLYEFCLRTLYEKFPELKLQEATTEKAK